jgi:hypothetical protein
MAILTRLAISTSLQTIDSLPRADESSYLTQVPLLPPPSHQSEREERRRVFWATFVLDRFVATSTGFPLSIQEKEIRAKLPCLELEFQMSRDCPAKHFTQQGLQNPNVETATPTGQADLWAICVESAGGLGRVMTWLRGEWNMRNTKIRKRQDENGFQLGMKLESWWKNLPGTVVKLEGMTNDNAGNIILLHATYST